MNYRFKVLLISGVIAVAVSLIFYAVSGTPFEMKPE